MMVSYPTKDTANDKNPFSFVIQSRDKVIFNNQKNKERSQTMGEGKEGCSYVSSKSKKRTKLKKRKKEKKESIH